MYDLNAEFIWLWAAVACYAAAGSFAIPTSAARERRELTVFALLTAALAMHSASLGLRWLRLGHGPFVTLFEILSSNVWSLTLVFSLACWRWRELRPAVPVVALVLLVMITWMLTTNPAAGHLPPTYDTGLLYVHVGLGKVFLGSVLVAVGISGIILLRYFASVAPRFAAIADNGRLEELAFRFMVFGFVFETAMLIAGAIWARDAWGRYWAWDPLETWSFITWLALAAFIHLRVTIKVKPPYSAALIMMVFALAFLTFFGVPFLSAAPHKGAI